MNKQMISNMKSTIISRLVRSKPSHTILDTQLRNSRLLSTTFKKVHEPLKVEEEALQVKPPSTEKLLVLGGNGYVGSHICREAIDCGLTVSSLSRSGRSSLNDSWADNVIWQKGDLLSPDSLKDALNGVTSVISCIGGFGSNSHMYKINGSANINAIKASAEQGVSRFVYISAADFGLINYILRGYYEGKRATEAELMTKFHCGGIIIRPGFIYGTRRVGNMSIPLGVIGAPMEMVLRYTKPFIRIPFVGPLLTTPVSVTAVAKVAVKAAVDTSFPPGIVDAYDILPNSQQK